MRSWAGVGGLSLLAMLTRAGQSQKQREEVCVSACDVRITRVATLFGENTSSHFDEFSEVSRMTSGQFVAGPMANGWHAVFTADGRFVRRFGGDVRRPTEMMYFARIVEGRADTIHLFDNVWRRELVFDGSGVFVRSRSLAVAPYQVLRTQNRLVIQSRVRRGPGAGHPFHILDSSGRVLRSFGADTGRAPDNAYVPVRVISPARDSTAFWSPRPNRYVIEKWSVDGQRLATISRDVDWFRPWDYPEDGPVRVVKPHTQLNSVWEDPNGLLWVLIRVPKADWKPAAIARRPDDIGELVTVEDAIAVFDSIVEVIDPRTSRTIASTRLVGPFGYFLHGGMVVGTRLVDGRIALEVSQVALTASSKPRSP